MDFLKKNMEVIKNNHRYLYNSIKNDESFAEHKKIKSIYCVETKDNDRALVIENQSGKFRLNSLYNPVNEAKIWAKQFNIINLSSVILMFGLGTGVFARAVLEKMKPDDSLFIYESSKENFYFGIENFDLTDILGDNRINIGIDNLDIFEFHENLYAILDITNMNAPIICMHPYMEMLYAESCMNFWKEIREAYIHVNTNINTVIRFGDKTIENILSNLRHLKNSNTVWELKDLIPKGATAIIVAAGPSVEKQIPYLKKAKGKALIFAVDRVLDYLLDSDVIPDFVVTLDPMKDVSYFSKRSDIKIPLLCFMDSNCDILNLHQGKKIICHCSDFLLPIYTNFNKMPPITISSPSVATVTFSICVELGIKTIVLVGQDLAYADEKTHVGDVEEKNIFQRDVLLEGINGELIRSRTDWKSFVIWFQDVINLYSDVTVIDTKDQGARIKGSINKSLIEVIDQIEDDFFDIGQAVDTLDKSFSDKDMLFVKKYLEKNEKILQRIINKAKVGIKECDKLTNMVSKNFNNNVKEKETLEKISKINQYIYNQPVYSLLDNVIKGKSAEYLVKIKQFSGDKKQDSLDTYEKIKSIYEIAIEAAEYIKPLLEKNISEVIKFEE